MIKKLLIAVAFSLGSTSVFAACSAIPLPILDGGGVSRNMSSGTSADGNCKTYIDADPSGSLYGAVTSPVPGLATSSEQTPATALSPIGLSADLVGKLIIMPYANKENFLSGQITSAMTGTTPTALSGMGAQGGSFKVYVTGCTFSNSHATVGTVILLQNGSGGATLWQVPAAPAFGGATINISPPISTSANTGVFAQNVTTGSNTFASCTGYKGT